MNGLYTFIGMAVCFACIGAVLKQLKPDLFTVYSACVAVVTGGYLISLLAPVVDYVKQLTDQTALPAFFGLLYKAVGVSLLCGVGAELCRACGESTLAAGVESVGKAAILLLSLPVVRYLLEAAVQLAL